MKIAFLVNDLHLSGGMNVIVKHANQLSKNHSHDVTIVITGKGGFHEWHYPELREVKVAFLTEVLNEEFDVAIATWWETIFNSGLVRAQSLIWFMQSLEDRFYPGGDPMQLLAQTTYGLSVPVITEAGWIRDFLLRQNPFRAVGFALNGIDKAVFNCDGRPSQHDAPIRILIEGSMAASNKGVAAAFDAVSQMKLPHETLWISPSGGIPPTDGVLSFAGPLSFEEMADVYRNSDVLLKLSRVEGMFGPPLEAFHCGATAIVTPVTGAEEYIVHGENSLVVSWDDVAGTAKVLDDLASDRMKLSKLQAGAMKTASSWLGWDESSEQFERELRRLSTAPLAVSTEEIRPQVMLLRSIRVPLRLMHENAIATLGTAVQALARVTDLESELREKETAIRGLETAHQEKIWWDSFRRRLLVRVLLRMRRLWRRGLRRK